MFYPRLKVTFAGHDSFRDTIEIDVDEFIGVKGFKAKGKRISTYQIGTIEELEPTRFPEKNETPNDETGNEEEEIENLDPDAGKSQQQVIDEITGQLSLFSDDNSQ